MFVEMGILLRSRPYTESEKYYIQGLMASIETVQLLTVSSVHHRTVLQGPLGDPGEFTKSHNEAAALLADSRQLALVSGSVMNTWRNVHYGTTNRKHGRPRAASLLI